MSKQRWTIIHPEWRYQVVNMLIPQLLQLDFATYRGLPGVQRALQFQELKALHDRPNNEESRTIQSLNLGASYVVCWELAKALKPSTDGELVKKSMKLLSSSLLSKNLKVRIYKTVILPVLLYGCETWTLTLREEHRLRVFENKVLRKIFGAKRDEVTGEWRKLHNTELHALYSSPVIIRNIKSRRLRWAGHVARMGESRNVYRVLVGRPEGKRRLGRPRRRWEDNIKMDLREVGYDDRDWINLAQDRDRWRAYVRAAMNLRAPTRIQIFLEKLPNASLPPEPVLICYGTWLKAAEYYNDHISEVQDIVSRLENESASIVSAKEVMEDSGIQRDLAFLKSHFDFLVHVIASLEAAGNHYMNKWKYFMICEKGCVPGSAGNKVRDKLEQVLQRNVRLKDLRTASDILTRKNTDLQCNIPVQLVSKLKYVLVTSVDVKHINLC
ncbi:hypothetical protein ANN_04214 [Periplaneta americana]|uniref:Uncharacterized protein n=1 Tax=Periplaneta americana TaxID=6978 RepID=A0ABQ8T9U3_PERAM|nr:hypothetical protein ANN_04214 [Periplaneta americana]